MNDAQATSPIRLADYRPPAWQVRQVELHCALDIDASEVTSRLTLRRDPTQDVPLTLDGEGLELLDIALDGRPLAAHAWRYAHGRLHVTGARDGSVLETRVRIHPASNTALEGLYLSGSREQGFLLTQCEAEGFRHITFFPDRPDVLAAYRVTLIADRARFPVLLAGGNPAGCGDYGDGRHWACFEDPHPKPSYLFALVAGQLTAIERDYTTGEGRKVRLKIWSEAEVIDQCHYAMDALERAMRWDEQRYGRAYDLDVFHVVATHDFNMGAMENKGLNIFNAKYLLAAPETSADEEYRGVEAVIAHEYFHNWSGNRVTCRDWFQLSLKEGLTVFREQQFCAEQHSAALKRIEDIALLRSTQFPEDAGPLAHPVRPAEYREINNFYTATVYEKGAELVRMLAACLGEARWRRGMDRYFSRHDGQAVTIEDFLAALGEANALDLSPYLAWYAQTGTLHLSARGHYDAGTRRYTLTLAQRTATHTPAPTQHALPIPVKLALFDPQGQRLPLLIEGRDQGMETVLVLDSTEQAFVFEHVPAAPVPSLLRDCSAPVLLECDYAPHELALLLRHDADGFNRWEAGQQLALRAYDALATEQCDSAALNAWLYTLGELFRSGEIAPDLLATLLTPPGEIELAERASIVDPAAIHAHRQALEQRLAQQLGLAVLLVRYRQLAPPATFSIDNAAQARRRLRRRVLELLARHTPATAFELAGQQYTDATCMSERLGALAVLVQEGAESAVGALTDYRTRYAGHALALDKWFAVQASRPGAAGVRQVRALLSDPAFSLRNPNRARALLGSFANTNPSGFHHPDGAGYALLVEQLLALDALNPQIAARLATAFNGWQRLEPVRRAAAEVQLTALANHPSLSRNLTEIVDNLRKVAA